MTRDIRERPNGPAARRRIVICGAAGRDFHNFNVRYRHDEKSQVVAFTATQIPGIAARRYPPPEAAAEPEEASMPAQAPGAWYGVPIA